jgi:hypothetical protein
MVVIMLNTRYMCPYMVLRRVIGQPQLLDIQIIINGMLRLDAKKDLGKKVFIAARGQGASSVLFRNAMGRKLGLNIADWECLGYVSMKGTSTPTELARYTGLTTGSTTAMLDRLEKAGYIGAGPIRRTGAEC